MPREALGTAPLSVGSLASASVIKTSVARAGCADTANELALSNSAAAPSLKIVILEADIVESPLPLPQD
jgi:hypothetical protein